MSKIGKKPVQIPPGVKVDIDDNLIKITGPNGELSFPFHQEIKVEVAQGVIKVARNSDTKMAKSLHGLTRSVIANMVKGVTLGHEKVLEIVGTGYRATKQGENLILNVGYSHPVIVEPVSGIQLDIRENKIIVSGIDKVAVGETAAKIRRVRRPEPYKGKGIRYADEVVRRKAGKAVKAVGGGQI